MIRAMDRASANHRLSKAARSEVAKQRQFFVNNGDRMTYASFRADSLPIGSGPVEAAGKTLVKIRLCRSGMRWTRIGGQAHPRPPNAHQIRPVERHWVPISQHSPNCLSLRKIATTPLRKSGSRSPNSHTFGEKASHAKLGQETSLAQLLNVVRRAGHDSFGRVLQERDAAELRRSSQDRHAVLVLQIELFVQFLDDFFDAVADDLFGTAGVVQSQVLERGGTSHQEMYEALAFVIFFAEETFKFRSHVFRRDDQRSADANFPLADRNSCSRPARAADQVIRQLGLVEGEQPLMCGANDVDRAPGFHESHFVVKW